MIMPFHFNDMGTFNTFNDTNNYWFLCDGNNSTPDLVNRFIYGGGPGGGKGYKSIGGSETVTLNVNQIPNHFHVLDINGDGNHGSSGPCEESRCNGGGRTYTSSSGNGGAHNNIPPFIRMAYFIYLPPE